MLKYDNFAKQRTFLSQKQQAFLTNRTEPGSGTETALSGNMDARERTYGRSRPCIWRLNGPDCHPGQTPRDAFLVHYLYIG